MQACSMPKKVVFVDNSDRLNTFFPLLWGKLPLFICNGSMFGKVIYVEFIFEWDTYEHDIISLKIVVQ